MPIYAFECADCGHAFDRLQKLSDPDPTACPACATGVVRRQLTAPQFRLSGSGWYETDFKKEGDRKRNLADKADAPAVAGEGKTGAADAKPAGDAAPKPAATSESKAAAALKPAASTAGGA